MFRPSENFLSIVCIACSLVVPFVTTTVLPFRSVGAEMVEAFGTISLVPATNIKGENATSLARSALAVVDPHSRSILFSVTAGMRSSEVTLTHDVRLLDIGKRRAKPFAAGSLGGRRCCQQAGSQQEPGCPDRPVREPMHASLPSMSRHG